MNSKKPEDYALDHGIINIKLLPNWIVTSFPRFEVLSLGDGLGAELGPITNN